MKVTVPSPLVLYGFLNADYSTAAYSDPFAMFADAAEVGRSEIEELVSLGCDYIQVDAPELATLVDPRIRDWAQAQGMPAERVLTDGIDLINGGEFLNPPRRTARPVHGPVRRRARSPGRDARPLAG